MPPSADGGRTGARYPYLSVTRKASEPCHEDRGADTGGNLCDTGVTAYPVGLVCRPLKLGQEQGCCLETNCNEHRHVSIITTLTRLSDEGVLNRQISCRTLLLDMRRPSRTLDDVPVA